MPDSFSNDSSKYRTYSDYLDAYVKHFVSDRVSERISIEDLSAMSKEDLLTIIEELYSTQQSLIETITNSKNCLSEYTSTIRHNKHQSTHVVYYAPRKTCSQKEDSFWDWINPFSL